MPRNCHREKRLHRTCCKPKDSLGYSVWVRCHPAAAASHEKHTLPHACRPPSRRFRRRARGVFAKAPGAGEDDPAGRDDHRAGRADDYRLRGLHRPHRADSHRRAQSARHRLSRTRPLPRRAGHHRGEAALLHRPQGLQSRVRQGNGRARRRRKSTSRRRRRTSSAKTTSARPAAAQRMRSTRHRAI